jgi:hypothetical protein
MAPLHWKFRIIMVLIVFACYGVVKWWQGYQERQEAAESQRVHKVRIVK